MALPSPQNLDGIALCAGAGGLELGVDLAVPGYRAVCWVERDAYAAAALVARMDDAALDPAPVWDDLVSFDGRPWRGRVDLVTAGYPCQPFSSAGRRRGTDDPRHLWPHVARIVAEVRPRRAFCENVVGHLDRGLDEVIRDLAGLGYRVAAGIFGAAEVGASHRRDRLFLLADADHGDVRDMARAEGRGGPDRVPEGRLPVSDSPGGGVLDAVVAPAAGAGPAPGGADGGRWFPPGPDDLAGWAEYLARHPGLQPALPRGDDGLADRMDRYRLVGNGVCPLAAAYAWVSLSADLGPGGAA